jgi:hypothetical protein
MLSFLAKLSYWLKEDIVWSLKRSGCGKKEEYKGWELVDEGL